MGDVKRATVIAALEDGTRPPVATSVAAAVFDELAWDEAAGVATYLESPDFEHLALQLLIGQLHRPGRQADVNAEVREQLRQSVRLHGLVAPDRLIVVVDALFDALAIACAQIQAQCRSLRPVCPARATWPQWPLATVDS